LKRADRLNRAIEFLPSNEEIADRRGKGRGLTSPERAVVLAYSKIWLYDELLGSTLPDDPWVSTALERYFPPLLLERFSGYMQRQPAQARDHRHACHQQHDQPVGSTFVQPVARKPPARVPSRSCARTC